MSDTSRFTSISSVISFISLLSLLYVPITAGSNASICIEKGQFADHRGPYKHLLFNDTLNGNAYYYPRPQTTHYLYPFKTSTDYYYFIGRTLYGSQIHSYCLIGNIGALGIDYLFNVNDCQYWAFYNETKAAWQHAPDMVVTECQFNNACVENSVYLPYLNTNYKFMYWNYTINGAYYYNEVINKWIYPYLSQIGNKTNAIYFIHETVGDTIANGFCGIGTNVPWYYVFNFEHCQIYRSYYQLSWHTEPNMTISTNCTNQPTLIPSKSPVQNPTDFPTLFATNNSSISETEIEIIDMNNTIISSIITTINDYNLHDDGSNNNYDNNTIVIIIITVVMCILIVIITIVFILYFKKKNMKNNDNNIEKVEGEYNNNNNDIDNREGVEENIITQNKDIDDVVMFVNNMHCISNNDDKTINETAGIINK